MNRIQSAISSDGRVLIDCLAVTLGSTIAAGPIGFMVFQLQYAVVLLMTQQTAVLANPFHIAVLTTVEIGDLRLLPSMRKTVCVYLQWDALYPYALST